MTFCGKINKKGLKNMNRQHFRKEILHEKKISI